MPLAKSAWGVTANHGESPSYKTLQSNAAIVEDILDKVEETTATVDRLAQAGRRFNASAAKQDLHHVASRVHNILASVDLAAPYVAADLRKVAEQMDHIYSLLSFL